MYPWGFWNSCVEPQKQHFIRGTIQTGDQQYMGKFKWEPLCGGKAKEICLVPGPLLLFFLLFFFNHLLTTDFDVDVDKMPEKQSSSIPLRESVRWVGGKAKQTEERSFIWDTQENYISASVSICWGTGGRRHGAGQSELGVRKGAPVDLSLETPPTLLLGSAQLLSSWYNAGGTAAPPPDYHTQPHNTPNSPPCAGATLTAWTPDPSIWRPDQASCSPMRSTAGSLLEWAAV